MNKVRALGLIGVGMLLAFVLMLGVGAAWAQGPMGGAHGMMGKGMMGGYPGMMGQQDMMGQHGNMAAMHAQMHAGEAMPEACQAMMSDPEMRSEMMGRMHSGTPMSLEEAKAWMTEHDVPADVQAECLAHMAEHHPATSDTPAP